MKVDLSGLDRLKKKLNQIENPDAAPLMARFATIMENDNRDKVLKGEDRYGSHMIAVKYRPKTSKPSKPSVRQRNGARANARFGVFGGRGPMNAGWNNSLTKSEYEKLAGPPLAPRGVFSRVITNFQTSIVKTSGTAWEVVGGWVQVVDAKGRKFLSAHFNGEGNLPVRDLRGVRPEGMAKARQAFVAWARDLIRFDR